MVTRNLCELLLFLAIAEENSNCIIKKLDTKRQLFILNIIFNKILLIFS